MCPLVGIPALVIFFMIDLAQTLIKWFSWLWKVIGGEKQIWHTLKKTKSELKRRGRKPFPEGAQTYTMSFDRRILNILKKSIPRSSRARFMMIALAKQLKELGVDVPGEYLID